MVPSSPKIDSADWAIQLLIAVSRKVIIAAIARTPSVASPIDQNHSAPPIIASVTATFSPAITTRIDIIALPNAMPASRKPESARRAASSSRVACAKSFTVLMCDRLSTSCPVTVALAAARSFALARTRGTPQRSAITKPTPHRTTTAPKTGSAAPIRSAIATR